MPSREPTKNPMDPEVAHARARVAALSLLRNHPEELAEARARLAALVRENRIRKLVQAAPPLTPEQRGRIAALLDDSGAA